MWHKYPAQLHLDTPNYSARTDGTTSISAQPHQASVPIRSASSTAVDLSAYRSKDPGES